MKHYKSRNKIKKYTCIIPTLGSDCGRIVWNIFDTPIIGSHARNYLNNNVNSNKWSVENIEELCELINNIGSGWQRAKLMDILDKLEKEKYQGGL